MLIEENFAAITLAIKFGNFQHTHSDMTLKVQFNSSALFQRSCFFFLYSTFVGSSMALPYRTGMKLV